MKAVIALFALILPLAGAAGTYGTEPPANVAQLQVLPGGKDGKALLGAFRIQLAPGWKTYWRSPGDAGIPPAFTWKGSENLGGVQFDWPAPEVFQSGGMQTIGYHDQLVLPFRVVPRQAGAPVRLKGRIDLGVCDEICVPFALEFDAALTGGDSDPAVAAALGKRVREGIEVGARRPVCTIEAIDDGLRLTAEIHVPKQGAGEVVVVETGTEGLWVSDAVAHRTGPVLTATAEIVPPDARPFPLDRSKLTFTVIGDGHAVELQGCSAG